MCECDLYVFVLLSLSLMLLPLSPFLLVAEEPPLIDGSRQVEGRADQRKTNIKQIKMT